MAIEVRLELSFTLELTAIDETEEKGLFTTHRQQNYTIIKYRYCGTDKEHFQILSNKSTPNKL